MSFRLVPKSVTLNDLEQRNGRYFALFQRIRVVSGAHCVKVHVRYLISYEFLYFNVVPRLKKQTRVPLYVYRVTLALRAIPSQSHLITICCTVE